MADWSEMWDGQLEVQPPLADQQLTEIPAKRGVLLLANGAERPITMIAAADIRSRIRNRLAKNEGDVRRKTPNLRSITRKILWKLAHGHFETDWSFFELSRLLWPESYRSMLAWKPAWFVHVNPEDRHPHFKRIRDVFARPGQYLGPFPNRTSAERLIESLQDAFDLCRHYERLIKSPHGRPCVYAQMGRCLCPCDGTITMGQYRRAVAKAAQFAAGRREAFGQELRQRMRAASDGLEFERASGIKARLERLADIETEAYAHVAAAESFRFILVQRGSGARQAKVFLVDRGRIAAADPLEYPIEKEQVRGVLRRMAEHAAATQPFDEADRWRMGLVAHYLFSSDQRRGLMFRWHESAAAEDLAGAIESTAGQLRLRAPSPRRGKGEENRSAVRRDRRRRGGTTCAPTKGRDGPV